LDEQQVKPMPMLLSFPRCPANLAGRMRHSLSFVRLSRTNIVDEMGEAHRGRVRRWPLGTRERLAFALLLYTGQRGGDVVKMMPSDSQSL
jgi:hypothetical protein